MNSNSFQRRCVYFSRGTLIFCSQTNLNIRPTHFRGGGGRRIGESLPKSLILGPLTCVFSSFFFFSFLFLANLGSSVRIYPYVSRMYSYVTRMLLVCTRMFPVCYSYVTRMYSYVLVCYSYVTRMFSYVPVCHSYVTRVVY